MKSRFLLDIGFDPHLDQNVNSKLSRIIGTMNLKTRKYSKTPLISTVHKLIWHFPQALASVITTFDHVVEKPEYLTIHAPSGQLCDQIPSSFRFTTLGYLFHLKLKYSHIHLSSHTHIHFTSGLPRSFPFCLYTWTLTAKKNGVL